LIKIATGEIGRRELLAMLVIYTASDVFLSYPQFIAEIAGESAWMIPLVSTFFLLVVFVAVWKFMPIVHDKGIVEMGNDAFGSLIGGILSLSYTGLFAWKAASVSRQFTETIVTTVLPRTPVSIITLCVMAVAAYFAYVGLEGLSRMSLIAGTCVFVSIIVLVALASPWGRGEFLFPLWGNGISSILRGSVMGTSAFFNLLLLLIVYPALQQHKRGTVRWTGFWALAITGIIFTGVELVFVMVFPNNASNKTPFPLYQLSRLIYFGRFFQRLESLFIFFWVASAVLKLSISIWAASYTFAQTFRMPVYRPIVAPMTLIVYSLGFMAPDFMTALRWDTNFIERYGWIIVVVIPSIVLVVDYFRTRKRRTGGGGSGASPREELKGAV